MVATMTLEKPPPLSTVICHEECGIYPCSDGEPMADSEAQARVMIYCHNSLETLYRERPDAHVSTDTFIYYEEKNKNRHIAPDVFVVFGAADKGDRSSWRLWEEGDEIPTFVLEIASKSTWREDAGSKRGTYAEIGISEYWRLNLITRDRTRILIGEVLLPGGTWEELEVTVDSQGRIWGYSPSLELWMCVTGVGQEIEFRFYNPATGMWLESHAEVIDRAEAERAAREAERAARETAEAAREAAEQRALRLEELLRRAGVDPADL